MVEPIRIDLDGALEGHHILVDPDELTFGLLEDLQSNMAKTILDDLVAVIVGGDLPKGTDRAGLRRLNAGGIQSLFAGVNTAFAAPKS